MISVGYSNRTPWDSPRELDEDDLAALIDAEAAKLADPARAVFNLHVPPKDTPIDQAVALDKEFRPVMRAVPPVITGVGQHGRAAGDRAVPADAEPARSHS